MSEGWTLVQCSYAVILPTLNGMKTIERAIDSIMGQTVAPTAVCAVDGGSRDGTWQRLVDYAKEYPEVFIACRNDLPDKHSVVIVHHYNKALDILRGLDIDFQYYFFHADDCVFPRDYVEKLAVRMSEDRIDVASGDWGVPLPLDRQKAPQGAGRLVTRRVMKELGFRFPTMYGYESWLLHKAEQLGFRLECYTDLRFELLTRFGIEAWHPTPEDTPDMPTGGHSFYEWGRGMRLLGYHPLYVLLRLFSDLLWNASIPRKYAIRMAWDYFETFWNPTVRLDPYCRTDYDKAYKDHMTAKQIIRVGHVLAFPVSHLSRLFRWNQ